MGLRDAVSELLENIHKHVKKNSNEHAVFNEDVNDYYEEFNDETFEQDWDSTKELISELVEQEQFIEACECLDSFFDRYNILHDWQYNLLRAEIILEEWDALGPNFDSNGDGDCTESVEATAMHRHLRNLIQKIENEGIPDEREDAQERFKRLLFKLEFCEEDHTNVFSYNQTWNQIHQLISSHYDIQKCFDLADGLTDDGSRDFDAALLIYHILFDLAIAEPNQHLVYVANIIDEYKSDIENCIERCLAEVNSREYHDKEEQKESIELAESVCESVRKKLEQIEILTTNTSSLSTDSSPETYTENEKEYLDEYKACLADENSISEINRRLLDRIAKSLNISPERIKQLEKSCLANCLTENEQEYINEYKACLADGVISESRRRLLDRVAKSLGISKNRVSQLENM